MAPSRQLKPVTSITTRSKSIAQTKNKRKADGSPAKEPSLKRSAFGDVTNAFGKAQRLNNDKKRVKQTESTTLQKAIVRAKQLPSVKTVVRPPQKENVPAAPVVAGGVVTRAATKHCVGNQTALKAKDPLREITSVDKIRKTRLSNEFEKTEESLYSSALDNISESSSTRTSSCSKDDLPFKSGDQPSSTPNISFVAKEIESKLNLGNHEVPDGVEDFDKENYDDIYQVSHYAMDLFNYLKSREHLFHIPDYMDRQVCLTQCMRSLLVDWMVEIQESFELNHETLYLGVKLVDMYLSKMTVGKETLQLVGAAAMFIASKYDERMPPLIDDFLYICDGAYTRKELVKMEINVLKICDFDLGIPISYRFLRRYARCAKVTMPVLTLARFILEYSLMDYATVQVRDSVLAAAALYLALRMKNISGWTPTLQFYSGFKLSEIINTVYLLNNGLTKKPQEQLMTVINKYSHKIFFEVAKTPTLKNEELLLS